MVDLGTAAKCLSPCERTFCPSIIILTARPGVNDGIWWRASDTRTSPVLSAANMPVKPAFAPPDASRISTLATLPAQVAALSEHGH